MPAQALRRLLGTAGDERKVVLIYGSRSVGDILLKDEIDEWARTHPHRLSVVYVVGEAAGERAPPGWQTTDTYTAEAGWIDEQKIRKHAFGPAIDTLVLVCGLPAMYAALCGPREETSVREGSTLAALGYTREMVAKL